MPLRRIFNWFLRRPLAIAIAFPVTYVLLLSGPLQDPPAVKEAQAQKYLEFRKRYGLDENKAAAEKTNIYPAENQDPESRE